MLIHNMEQGSEDWLKMRLGKITASDFHTLLGDSQTKETILYKKAAERLTDESSDGDKFSSIHTDRGHELEGDARIAYEMETGNVVIEVGFAELDGQNIGCSPDGLIHKGGGIEIKCLDNHGFLRAVLKQYINPAHKTQMQFSMYVCGRSWWDYVLYNPNFPNPVHIMRVPRDDAKIEEIKRSIEECNVKIESYMVDYQRIMKK